MSPRRTLFKPPSFDESTLPYRQEVALKFIDAQGGVHDEALGYFFTSSDKWAKKTGFEILQGLRKKGLVKRRRSDGLWVRVGALAGGSADRGGAKPPAVSRAGSPERDPTPPPASVPYNEFPDGY